MITHSKAILYILLIDMAALLMYNVSGMCVTGASSSPPSASSRCSRVDRPKATFPCTRTLCPDTDA